MHTYHVYILASRTRRLYVGVTGYLARRLEQHRQGEVAFTQRYRVDRLVHAETTNDVYAALAREKQIKGWLRQRKIELIERANPTWDDWGDALLERQADPSLRSG